MRAAVLWMLASTALSGCATLSELAARWLPGAGPTTTQSTAQTITHLTTPAQSTLIVEPQPTTSALALTHFTIDARFNAVDSQGQAWPGQFTWRREPEEDRIELRHPMGGVVAQLWRVGDCMRMGTSADLSNVPCEIEWAARLQRDLGFALPLNHLPFWLQGLPKPDEAYNANRADRLVQAGWVIDIIARHEPDATGRVLPRRINAEGPAGRLSLVIGEWSAAK